MVLSDARGRNSCSDWEECIETFVSQLLSVWCDFDMTTEVIMLKSVFLDVEVEPLRAEKNHTHGESAAARSTASLMIDRIASTWGKKITFYQGSSADLRKNRQVSRRHLWVKDVQVPVIGLKDPEAIAMVDVDYYVDMPKFIYKDFVPYLLYTMQPSKVARDYGEYKYTFNSRGEVEYTVSGGGFYQHKLWNWTGDHIMVKRKNWFGLTNKISMYAIERKRVDEDHQVVLLAPLRQYNGWMKCFLVSRTISGKPLERLNVVQGEFTRLRINTDKGMFVSTGKVGGYSNSLIPMSVDDAISSAYRALGIGGHKLTLATVKSKLEQAGVDSSVGSEVLLEYHLTTRGKAPLVSLLSTSVRRYQWIPDGKQYDDYAKPGMVAFMEPLVNGAFVADDCINNDQRAVEERVTKLKTTPLVMSSFVSLCMDEFIDMFYKSIGLNTLQPVGNEVVYEKQNRPAQRRILDLAQHGQSNDVAMNFVKREAYETVNDPRVISQINGVDKMHYSAFIYALKDVFKQQKWYGFGKTPREIADRVTELCMESDTVSLTDFSRMDGRITNIAREFETRLMLKGFKREYHLTMYELMRKQYCLRGRTKHGVRYDTGYARSSGSAETSEFNTALNAFICFMAYRRMIDQFGAYYDKTKAWNMLGVYAGDDGLSRDLDPLCARRAAESMGQVLELETIHRGNRGVSFLARRYGPDVWFGDNNSCCSLSRTLSKFHTTVHLPSNISQVEKLKDKAFALWLTDRNTPLIGLFVNKVLSEYPMSKDTFRNLAGAWNVETDQDKQYPNERAEWMDDLLQEELPGYDLARLEAWLDTVNGVGLLCPPSCLPDIQAVAKPGKVAVDGDIVVNPPKTIQPKNATPPKVKYRARKRKELRQSRTNLGNS
jgi:hypothetical protein